MVKSQEISELYRNGFSYRDIQAKTGYCSAVIGKAIKKAFGHGRSASESVRLARKAHPITEETRQKLSNASKKLILNSNKIWTKPERKFKDILNSMNIGVRIPPCLEDLCGVGEPDGDVYFQYPLQRYICDFVDPNRMVVYQINGDFWHANPALYNPKKLSKVQASNVNHDKNRLRYLISKGYNVCTIWESEIYWNIPMVIEKVRATRELANPPRLHRGDARINTEVAQLENWSETLKNLWFKKPRTKKTTTIDCYYCGNKFIISTDNKRDQKRKFCGQKCWWKFRTTPSKPSRAQLLKDIESMSLCAVGRKYKVSDNTIRKWARHG